MYVRVCVHVCVLMGSYYGVLALGISSDNPLGVNLHNIIANVYFVQCELLSVNLLSKCCVILRRLRRSIASYVVGLTLAVIKIGSLTMHIMLIRILL